MKLKINPTIIAFIKKELLQTLRDPKMRIFLFISPLIQLTLFGVALNSDVKNVRLAIAPSHNDAALQHVYERALAGGWFIAAQTSRTDPYEQIQANEADAVLIPPPGGLTEATARGQGRLQLLINASNVIKAQSVETYMRNIIDEVVRTDFRREKIPPPIRFHSRVLFNPTMRSAVFMVPGVMSMLICLMTITLSSMSFSREKETGTFEMLISAPVQIWELMLGKSLPYLLIGMSNIPLILGAALLIFDVPMRGSLLLLFFCAFIFICTTLCIGLLISTITRTQQQSMMGGFLFLFPAIQLSGLMFPIENMPPIMKVLAYLNPLTYFLELLRNIMLKGGNSRVVGSHLLVLTLVAISLIIFTYRKFRTTLN